MKMFVKWLGDHAVELVACVFTVSTAIAALYVQVIELARTNAPAFTWWTIAVMCASFLLGWFVRRASVEREPSDRRLIRAALAGMHWQDLDRLKRLYCNGELRFAPEFNPDSLPFVRSGMAYWVEVSGTIGDPDARERTVKMEPEWRSRIGLNSDFFFREIDDARKKSTEASRISR